MQATIKINATVRTEHGKQVQKLRKAGKLPAILYGHKIKSIPLTVDQKDFQAVFSKSGETTLIELAVDSGKPQTVLVHDAQHGILDGGLLHVDFYAVDMTEKIKTKVPLVFTGEPKAVKDLGGVLLKSISEVEVESLPGDLPASIEIDVSGLSTFEDFITIADIKINADKVKIIAKPDDVIAKVMPPRSDEELKALEEKPVEEVSAVEGVVKETPAAEAAETETPEKKQ